MVVADGKQLELMWVFSLFLVVTVLGEDAGGSGQNLQTRMFFGRFRRFRMAPMASKPAPPILKAAIDRNICAEYDPNVLMPLLNPINFRETRKCQAAAQYLFASNTQRPDDCQGFFGAFCGQEGQGTSVCMVRTRLGLFSERPLSYCAQNFKPHIPSMPDSKLPTLDPIPLPKPFKPPTPADDKTPDQQPPKPVEEPAKKPDPEVPQKPAEEPAKKPDPEVSQKPVEEPAKKPDPEVPQKPVEEPAKKPDEEVPKPPEEPVNKPDSEEPPKPEDQNRRPDSETPTTR